MARCPFAKQRILSPENANAAKIVPRSVILHTAVDGVGPTDLATYFDGEAIGAESTFFVHMDGSIDQMMDTEKEADANGIADKWAISVETEDDSARRGSDILPWTAAQVEALIRLIDWCCTTHNIPRKRCTSSRLPGASGIGYHSQPMRERFDGTSHNPWTAFQGKSCPGDKRVAQYPGIVSRVATLTQPPTPEEDDMEYKDWSAESKKKFWDDFKLFAAPVITGSQVASVADKQTNLGDVINKL